MTTVGGLLMQVLLPGAALMLAGWVLPRALARVFPEGPRALILLALVAAVLMLALSALVFLILYVLGGMPLAELAGVGEGAALAQFLRLGALSALLWAPILILSVAGLPRRWRHAVW